MRASYSKFTEKSEYRKFCLICNLLHEKNILEMVSSIKDFKFQYFFHSKNKWNIHLQYINIILNI